MQFTTIFLTLFAAAGTLAAPAAEGVVEPRQNNGSQPVDIPGINNPDGHNALCGFADNICIPGRGFRDCDAQCQTCSGKYGNFRYGRCCGQTKLSCCCYY